MEGRNENPKVDVEGKTPPDDDEGRKGQVGELAVDDEGKLLLRCAERDAQRASSVLVWKKVISRGEMRERATFLWDATW